MSESRVNDPVMIAKIGEIFLRIDRMFTEGKFEEVDAWLVQESSRIHEMEATEIVAILSVTLCAAAKLPMRPRFFKKCRNRLLQIEINRVDRLLKGLQSAYTEEYVTVVTHEEFHRDPGAAMRRGLARGPMQVLRPDGTPGNQVSMPVLGLIEPIDE